MLNSLEIYQALNELGYRLEAGKFEPSYASEHALGDGKYLYVKRSRDGVVHKSPLVLAPETVALKTEIDRIAGIHCLWDKVKSTSYRRYPKDNGTSQYGFAADVESVEALQVLVALLGGQPSSTSQYGQKRDNKNKEQSPMHPLNQILFGPPGTGKTYSTTEMAVKIADYAWYQQTTQEHRGNDLRELVKERYKALVEKQRIMFTTFHQSFSYEDFIEGIRATTTDYTKTRREEVLAKELKNSIERIDGLKNVFKSQTINGYFAKFSMPLVAKRNEIITRAIKPLAFEQTEPGKMMEHGDTWIMRVTRAAEENLLDLENVLFTIEEPENPSSRQIKVLDSIKRTMDSKKIYHLSSNDEDMAVKFAVAAKG